MTITLAYRSVDRFSERKTFKTLVGARRYAAKRVGLDAEAWGNSATSFDGIGVLTLVEVMKEPPIAPFPIRDMEALLRGKAAPAEPVATDYDEAERIFQRTEGELEAAELRALVTPKRSPGCTCSDQQLSRVGCDCGAEMPPPF
jgi:hypothetical protein